MHTLGTALWRLAGTVAISVVAACAGPDGQTPTCTNNVDENGIHADPAGCAQFATCTVAPSDPAQCCVDSTGAALTGSALQICLFGFGAGPALADGGNGG